MYIEYLKGKNITGEVTMPFAVEEMLGEKKQNMLISIHTAKRGRLSWCMMKLCAVLIVSICIGVVIFIPDIVNITKAYNIDDMQTAIQNYPRFSFVPFKMSLMAYLICNIIWKLVLLMAIAGIVVLISTMSGYVLSLVVSLALVLPQLLYMLGDKRQKNCKKRTLITVKMCDLNISGNGAWIVWNSGLMI
jgi:hypothetical protein